MKNKLFHIIFLCVILLISSCAKRGIDRGTILPDKNFHLFLLAGQSNMAGRGVISAEDSIINPKILMLNKEYKWVPAVDPIHYDKSSAGVGLAKSFALELLKNDSNITIGLVPAACGGSPISSWAPGQYHDQTKSYPYDDAIVRTKKAMEYGFLKGILWHQGESDSNPQNAIEYQEKLKTLIENFRSDFRMKYLPFIIGQLGQFPGRSWSEFRKLVNEAQISVSVEMKNVSFVSSDDLTSNPDSVHFNSKSLKVFGKGYANSYLDLED